MCTARCTGVWCTADVLLMACRFKEGCPIAAELIKRQPPGLPSSCPITADTMHWFKTGKNRNKGASE
jgi:hypothetical protein